VTHKALCTGKKPIRLNGLLCAMMHVMYNAGFPATTVASKILTFLNANNLKYQVLENLLNQVISKSFRVSN